MATSIPAFHVSTISKASGDGKVFIASRQDALSSGVFYIKIEVSFDPSVDDYPQGGLRIETDLSDSAKGKFESTSVELINSYGKHNPTVYLTGRCKTPDDIGYKGLRYWVMVADNTSVGSTDTWDVVGFVIHDRNGDRVAYGTGPLDGNITVMPN